VENVFESAGSNVVLETDVVDGSVGFRRVGEIDEDPLEQIIGGLLNLILIRLSLTLPIVGVRICGKVEFSSWLVQEESQGAITRAAMVTVFFFCGIVNR
jgi:hypothetical protein